MKKIILLLIVVAASFTTYAKDKIVTQVEELPKSSIEFINKYYNDKEVSYIKVDGNLIWKDYDVVFTNGVEIEFNHKGDWKDISSKNDTIPAELIPDNIKSFLQRNYPNKKINKIEKFASGYEVKIEKGFELKFDANGNFKRIDD